MALEHREFKTQIWVKKDFDREAFEKALTEQFPGCRAESGDEDYASRVRPGYQLLDIYGPVDMSESLEKLTQFLDLYEEKPELPNPQ